MHIVMLTNIYWPLCGGLTRSIDAFVEQFQQRGHEVLIIAPQFTAEDDETLHDAPVDADHVLRIPSVRQVLLDRYSFPLPLEAAVTDTIERFQPQIVHAHHPFLLGNTAIRMGARRGLPLVYTHHTRYDVYVEQLLHMPALQPFVNQLAAGFCNLCDLVIAPSGSIAADLRRDGVTAPIEVIPTGVDYEKFSQGDGDRFRQQHDIPQDVFLVGHIGRWSEEKNIPFLIEAVLTFLKRQPQAHFLLGGDGELRGRIEQQVQESGLAERVHFPGFLNGQELVDAFTAMDVFTISSKSETQGMVVQEAMAAGVPVIGLDASGIRDAVIDGQTGRLVDQEDPALFAQHLEWFLELPLEQRQQCREAAQQAAAEVRIERCAERLLAAYHRLLEISKPGVLQDYNTFTETMEGIWEALQKEVLVVGNTMNAAAHAIGHIAWNLATGESAYEQGQQKHSTLTGTQNY